MPIEGKVNDCSTNSVKRLNNDAAVKARAWREQFDTRGVVPAEESVSITTMQVSGPGGRLLVTPPRDTSGMRMRSRVLVD